MTVKELITIYFTNALKKIESDTRLPPNLFDVSVQLETPKNPNHGDFATSLALRLAKPSGMNPKNLAAQIINAAEPSEIIERIWVEGPGFINISLRTKWLVSQVDCINNEGYSFGNSEYGKGDTVQVEFVSVNPTGPVHVGHARGAILGDSLSNILDTAGFRVTREYYFNDAGAQMDLFYRSLYARYLQLFDNETQMPDRGYMGDYMLDLAQVIFQEFGEEFVNLPQEEALSKIGVLGLERMLQNIQDDLDKLKITFDVWFKEHTLYELGQFNKAMTVLQDGNHITKRDGATWFVSSALGEEKDNVIIRSTGIPTYFAADIAYHYNKFIERKFSKVINVWGADHQGHVSRMKAAVGALGVSPENLTVLITQIVTLKRGSNQIRASKRSGEFITLKELIEEVGSDPCRYFFLARSPDSQMEFDIELAKKESSENPVYYIQYAHARTCSILKVAQANKIDYKDGDPSLLRDETELNLIRKMLAFPDLIKSMAETLEPHHLPHYSQELASLFHLFYQKCRVVSSKQEDSELTKARIKLVRCAKFVLGKSLSLMGMEAPETM